MEPSDQKIQQIKTLLEKQHGREFSWEEATEAAWDMESLSRIFFDVVMEEMRREQRLKEFPKGFHLDRTIQSGRLLFKEINPLFSYNGK